MIEKGKEACMLQQGMWIRMQHARRSKRERDFRGVSVRIRRKNIDE